MSKDKIFNFKEFLIECYNPYPVNEGKGGEGIDESLIIKILEAQKRIVEKKIENKKGKSSTTWQLLLESLKYYNELEESVKKQILDDFIKKAKKAEVDSEWIEKKIKKAESEGTNLENPRIIVTKKTNEIPGEYNPDVKKDEKSKSYEKIQLIPDEIQETFFKDNKWIYDKENLESTFQESYEINGNKVDGKIVIKEIVTGMKSYIEQDFKSKGNSIKSINISTSCSRYRNSGNDTNVEKLSWAKLGFNRAQTFAKMIAAAAKEASGEDTSYVNELMKKVKVDYLGSNGDGTSGPDPIEKDFRKGYYDDKGFHDVKSNNPLEISVIEVEPSENGIKFGSVKKVKAKNVEGNEMTKDLASKKDYEPFKFALIEIETFPLDNIEGKKSGGNIEDEEEINPKLIEKYKYTITLYKKSSSRGGGDFHFPPSSEFFRTSKRRRKFKPDVCPKW